MIGLEEWFYNFTQWSRRSITTESLATIPRPHAEYALYWTFKCAQVASFVGGLIVHPAYRFYLLRQLKPDSETTTPNSTKIIRNKCRRIQGRFLLAGLAFGPILSVMITQFNGWNRRELQNRCYAIRLSEKELVWDRCSVVLFFVGWYWKRFQGAVDGINLALLYTIFYHNVTAKYTVPFFVNKIKADEAYPSVEVAETHKDKLTQFLASKGRL